MRALWTLLTDTTDERFRTAVLLGLASIPFTAVENWPFALDPRSGTFSGMSLLVACVLSGYLYGSRVEGAANTGILTGVVGGFPVVLWASATTLVEWWGYPPLTDVVGDSIAAVAVLAALLTALIGAVILLVVGWIGGSIGGWASKRIDPPRSLGSRS